MNRRDAIARVGLILGGTIVGADAFLSGCSNRKEGAVTSFNFSTDTVAFLDEVGETILPATPASPGAKAAFIGNFMKAIVTDCYEEKDQLIFADGITQIEKASQKKFKKDFIMLSSSEKHELLVQLDQEAKAYEKARKPEDPTHYFTMMKQLTLWGFFTSEVGSKQALRYNPIPGRYEGCIPYKKGDRAWADI